MAKKTAKNLKRKQTDFPNEDKTPKKVQRIEGTVPAKICDKPPAKVQYDIIVAPKKEGKNVQQVRRIVGKVLNGYILVQEEAARENEERLRRRAQRELEPPQPPLPVPRSVLTEHDRKRKGLTKNIQLNFFKVHS